MVEKHTTRIDKWLWVVRIFKTREMATKACTGGKIKIDGTAVKASRNIQQNDVIQVRKDVVKYLYKVLTIAEKRIGAKLIIVLRRGTKYQGFSTRAFKLGESCEDPCLIPEYYRYLFFEMNVWFEIGELTPMHSNELAKYTEDIVYAVKRRRSISKTLASAGY